MPVTPVRCPMRTNSPKTAIPMRLPATRTMSVSRRPNPRLMPSAPRTQLIGAMFAPHQIQNWPDTLCRAVGLRDRLEDLLDVVRADVDRIGMALSSVRRFEGCGRWSGRRGRRDNGRFVRLTSRMCDDVSCPSRCTRSWGCRVSLLRSRARTVRPLSRRAGWNSIRITGPNRTLSIAVRNGPPRVWGVVVQHDPTAAKAC